MISDNAARLLRERYCSRGESPESALRRVANWISIKDKTFEEELFKSMITGTFFPNSPCLRNAGKKRGVLHACFILPLEDSINSIFETVRNMAIIFKCGGGVGINFSNLRPKDAPLSSGGTSSGALSFMGIFDAITETVKQGGFRRGALMGILNPSHPEILDFCRSKFRGILKNFNLSIMVTDDFMEKATSKIGGTIDLIHEGTIYNTIRPKDILDIVALGSWDHGDPALLFQDRINKDNKLYPKTILDTTNPCSEVALPNFGACCLGSINLSKFVEGTNFNFEKFYETVKMVSRALLHMNIIGHYPIPQIRQVMSDLNPIGVGLMGFADALIMLGIKYDSNECLEFIDKLAEPYIKGTEEVAHDSFYKRIIAPTGSLSILGDCSSGVEPVFARSFERHLTVGIVEEHRGLYTSENTRTAYEVSPDWHLRVQSKFQSIVDGGISKTINLPNNTSVDEIKEIYKKAWKMGVKGVTVFREGSIEGVLKPKMKCSDESCTL